MTFEELGVSKNLVDRLSQKSILNPTSIQSEAFSPILSKKSLLGMSKTGTGKTLAYILPLMNRMLLNEAALKGGIVVLVLVPTRELATQVSQTVDFISARSDMGVVVVGGESEEAQTRLSQSAKFMIATPGRLLDLLKRRLVNLSEVETVVFDEADRLLDMGFVDDMREIMKQISRPDQQLLFFSATTHFGIDEMAYEFGVQDLMRIGKESDELTVAGLDHRVAFVGEPEKFHALVAFLHTKKNERGIVFSNYRDKAHEIAGRLRKGGCYAEVLTAQLTQSARSRIMEQFRSGKVQVLVASDLAARGIDVSDVDFVVNYDLPDDSATYVHRVGRTARAGKKGIALSLVGFDDAFRLEKLEKFLGHAIERYRFEAEQLSGPLLRFAEDPIEEVSERPEPSSEGNYRGKHHQRSSPQGARVSPSKGRHDRPVATRSSQPMMQKVPSEVKTTEPTGSLWQRIRGFLRNLFGQSNSADAKKQKPQPGPVNHSSTSKDRSKEQGRRGSGRPFKNQHSSKTGRGSRNFSGPRGGRGGHSSR